MSSLFTNSNTNILDQLSGYNSDTLDTYIKTINHQIEEQKQLNNLLKKENYEETIQDIKTFIERNKTTISYQLQDLKDKVTELKQLIAENHDLEHSENKYDELLVSDEYKEVADDLHTIKKLREEITLFLSDQGIVLPRF